MPKTSRLLGAVLAVNRMMRCGVTLSTIPNCQPAEERTATRLVLFNPLNMSALEGIVLISNTSATGELMEASEETSRKGGGCDEGAAARGCMAAVGKGVAEGGKFVAEKGAFGPARGALIA